MGKGTCHYRDVNHDEINEACARRLLAEIKDFRALRDPEPRTADVIASLSFLVRFEVDAVSAPMPRVYIDRLQSGARPADWQSVQSSYDVLPRNIS